VTPAEASGAGAKAALVSPASIITATNPAAPIAAIGLRPATRWLRRIMHSFGPMILQVQ
jgi:hypothetical protein